jgi:uncharacterized protein
MGKVIQFPTADSLRNVVAGLGDPARDKVAGSVYGFQCLDDLQLFNIYQSNWLGRKIVDIPAMDAVRKGRDWQAQPDQIQAIETEENRLDLWRKLLDVKIKARLWGGAALLIGTGDVDLMQPLEPARIGRGGIKYLSVVTRRDVTPGPLSQDITSEYFRRPDFYYVNNMTLGRQVTIHPSRLAVFVGAPHADEFLAPGPNYGWGGSIIDTVYTAMKHADSSVANIASLIFESNVDVFRIPGFMDSLGDPEYQARLLTRWQLAATAKSVNRALLLDKDEEYDRKTISFVGLPDVIMAFMQAVSGAADIPMTRLFGQAPAGMNATGESDLTNYYDRVSSIQNLEMTPSTHILNECLISSALGSRPAEIFYMWSPLKQMTDKELADIGQSNANTAKILRDTGIFTDEELRKVATTQFVESGFYPGLDQVVDETGVDWKAELDPPSTIAPVPPDPRAPVATRDATPRSLYVKRDVLNGADIVTWAKGQGFTSTLAAADMHVTIVYSRLAVDWLKMGNSWDETLIIPAGGPRVIETFNGGAVVLAFANRLLEYRHADMISSGASSDYPDYQPHITITYDGAPTDLSKVQPYQGEIRLGPERFEEANESEDA